MSVLSKFIEDAKPEEPRLGEFDGDVNAFRVVVKAFRPVFSAWEVAKKALESNADVLGDDEDAIQAMYDDIVAGLE